MAQISYEDLEKRQNYFLAPSAQVVIDGKEVSGFDAIINSVEICKGTGNEAGVCTIVLTQLYDIVSSRFICEDKLNLGAIVEVKLGYIYRENVFRGFIQSIEYTMGIDNEPTVELTCFDVKGAMMGAGTLDFTGELTIKQIINGFFSGKRARGYSALCDAPDLGALSELDKPAGLSPDKMDDFAFLSDVADYFKLEFFVEGDKLILRKRPASGSYLIELSPMLGISHISAKITAAGYIKKVNMLGVNDNEHDSEKKIIKHTVNNTETITSSASGKKLIGNRSVDVFKYNITDRNSAKTYGEAYLSKSVQRYKEVTVELQGLPEITVGSFLKLCSFTAGFNGIYYIAGLTHSFSAEDFKTVLSLTYVKNA